MKDLLSLTSDFVFKNGFGQERQVYRARQDAEEAKYSEMNVKIELAEKRA